MNPLKQIKAFFTIQSNRIEMLEKQIEYNRLSEIYGHLNQQHNLISGKLKGDPHSIGLNSLKQKTTQDIKDVHKVMQPMRKDIFDHLKSKYGFQLRSIPE